MKSAVSLMLILCGFSLPAKPASDSACANCHAAEAKHFHSTPMAQALERVSDCAILKQHPDLSFVEGPYRSRIVREGGGSTLTVTRGEEILTVPLLWAFGRGQAGQTYVFEYNGAMYESRISFYNALGNVDLTMGAMGTKPQTLAEAAGRRMDAIGTRDCFACHSHAGVTAGKLRLEALEPGVGCESCHGSVEKHLAAMQTGDAKAAKPAHLGGLSSEEVSELCGRCHRTWSQIALSGPRGVNNVRFQPYRLANSKCYDAVDPRIRCSACHDPHGALETNLASYDSKCAACHSAALHTKICRVAKSNCAGCHMPKVELPGAHARFTDHQIRIARAGDPYPN